MNPGDENCSIQSQSSKHGPAQRACGNLRPSRAFNLMEMTLSDGELMARVKAGDRDGFAVLIDRYKHRLVNYLTLMVHDRDRAEELAQETFVRLYVHRARYQERGRFVPYLYRMATNLLRTEIRRRQRREVLLHLFARNGNRESPSPHAELVKNEVGERVAEAIEALPLHYRSPLLLREMEGWSYRDIATALKCREGTVKSRVHRGRERLRKLLEPYWNGGYQKRL